jgi:O-antigen ligase
MAVIYSNPISPRPSWSITDWGLTIGLGLYGFFASSSVAGMNVAQALLLLVAVPLLPRIVQLAPWRCPPMLVGLVLWAYIGLHSLWRTGWTATSWHALNHYQELLLAPLFLALMQLAPDRRVFYRALIAGAALLALMHWVNFWGAHFDNFLEGRRISASFAFVICAFFLLLQARCHAHPWKLRALAAFFAATVLFSADSRTGYVTLVALASLAAWLHSPPRWRWGACLIVPIMVVALAWSSNAVQKRLHETVADSQTEQVTTTSTGIRVHMLRITKGLVREHYLLGAGFGNYAALHHQAVKDLYANDPEGYAKLPETWTSTGNPHNEYLMQLVGGGIAALALFLGWLGITMRQAFHLPPQFRPLLIGLCIAFALGSVFNSLLLDFVEGHLYMAVLAWLLAAGMPSAPERNKPSRHAP